MSMLTYAYIVERYGARLTMADLADVLRLHLGTVRNRVSAGTLGVKTYLEGANRFADAADVADYLDAMRKEAA